MYIIYVYICSLPKMYILCQNVAVCSWFIVHFNIGLQGIRHWNVILNDFFNTFSTSPKYMFIYIADLVVIADIRIGDISIIAYPWQMVASVYVSKAAMMYETAHHYMYLLRWFVTPLKRLQICLHRANATRKIMNFVIFMVNDKQFVRVYINHVPINALNCFHL